MKTRLTIFITALLLASAVSAQPRVLASIKPLQLIAAAVLGETGEPELLAPSSASPHEHSLRPSERARLDQADVLLWVGEELEFWLAGVAASVDARQVRAASLPDLVRRDTGAAFDPHVWLDPDNARVIAAALARELAALDSANTAAYEANLAAFDATLQGLDEELRGALEASAATPYAVYHDAFGYFEARYGLEHVTEFTGNEEVMPGIRELLAIRARLESAGASCILVEPGVNVEHLRNVVEIDGMRYVEVDALGHSAPLAEDGFAALLRGVADAVLDCLERE